MMVASVVTTIGALRSFDIVYVTTAGGPGRSTTLPAWEVYQRAFLFGDFGASAAVGVSLAVVIFGVVFVLTRALGRGSD